MDKLLNRLVWPVIIIPAAYLAFIWQQLPEQVAMHFDWKGNPDRMGSRSEMITTTILLTVMRLIMTDEHQMGDHCMNIYGMIDCGTKFVEWPGQILACKTY